jgi:hypothetical protein
LNFVEIFAQIADGLVNLILACLDQRVAVIACQATAP